MAEPATNPDTDWHADFYGMPPGTLVKVIGVADETCNQARVGQVGRVAPELDEGLLVVDFGDGLDGFWPQELLAVDA